MKTLPPEQLLETFNKDKDRWDKWAKERGIDEALHVLSSTVHALQAAGKDITLEMHGCVDIRASKLFSHTRYTTIHLSGVLRIGTSQQLLAFGSAGGQQTDLVISAVGTQAGDPSEKDTKTFDLAQNPDSKALVRLQQYIAGCCALKEMVESHDSHGVFEGNKKVVRKASVLKPQ